MQNPKQIQVYLLASSMLIFLFLFYNYNNPDPFRFERKKETVKIGAVSFLMESKNSIPDVKDYLSVNFNNSPIEFIRSSPGCCHVWVFYRGVAPNKYLEEHSLRNLSDKLATFVNLEMYLVRVRIDNGTKIVRADLQVSPTGRVQEYWFNFEGQKP